MALADTAKLVVDLSLKGNFARQLGTAGKSLDAFTKGENRAFKAGAQIGTGIRNAGKIAAVGVGILTSQVALGLDSLIQLEKATAQTEAVIKSTGGAAGQSAGDIRKLAEGYEALNATMGDEVIQSGANVLLTFTNIRKKAFEPALAAALDLSTAMDQDLQSSIVQVGKALNDPIRGITALRRVGVQLSEAQEDQIKTLVEQNDLYGAQQVILKELNKEFGGSFLGRGNTTAAKVAKFGDAIEDLQRSLAVALLPTVSNVADALSDFLADPAIAKGAEDLGREIGNLFSKGNIQSGIGALREVFAFAREVAPVVGAAAKTTATFVRAAVSAFKSLPPEIQSLAIGAFAVNKLTGGLVTNIGGGLISAVLQRLKSAVVTVHGGVVHVSGPQVPGAAPTAPAGGGGLGAAVRNAGKVAAVVLAPAAVLELGSAVAGAQRESANRIINSQGNIARTVADGNQRLAIIRNNISALEQRAAAGDSMAQRQLDGQRALLADLIGGTKRSTSATIEAGVKAKNASMETKAQVASSAMIQQALLSAQMATTRMTAAGTQGAVRSVAPPIVGAIRANRPITTVTVNVTATHVTKSTTVQKRYGPGGGSGSQNARPGDSGV